MKPRHIIVIGLLLLAASAQGQTEPAWSPARGAGTYRNPIIHADYSDPDVVRVGGG
jgi:hypothetical protein